MSIFIHKDSTNVTAVGGTADKTISNLDGVLMHLIIRASTESTIFDFVIYDEDNVVIWERNDVDGLLNEQLAIPLKGDYTFSVRNSTADELYRIYIGIREL